MPQVKSAIADRGVSFSNYFVNISLCCPSRTSILRGQYAHNTEVFTNNKSEFLFTPEAQQEFAQAGFRPIKPTISKDFTKQYPEIKKLFTVEDLGGWDKIQTKFFIAL